MEVELSTSLKELNALENKPSVKAVAIELDNVGYDHIPSIMIRSSRQYKNLLLDYAGQMIDEARTYPGTKDEDIKLAEAALQSVLKVHSGNVYKVSRDDSKNLDLAPMSHSQLDTYLTDTIKKLRKELKDK